MIDISHQVWNMLVVFSNSYLWFCLRFGFSSFWFSSILLDIHRRFLHPSNVYFCNNLNCEFHNFFCIVKADLTFYHQFHVMHVTLKLISGICFDISIDKTLCNLGFFLMTFHFFLFLCTKDFGWYITHGFKRYFKRHTLSLSLSITSLNMYRVFEY